MLVTPLSSTYGQTKELHLGLYKELLQAGYSHPLLPDPGAIVLASCSFQISSRAHFSKVRNPIPQPYRPRTNGKAERLIQTALREWAYGPTRQTSDQRNQALNAWLHFYNHHRPHSALGR